MMQTDAPPAPKRKPVKMKLPAGVDAARLQSAVREAIRQLKPFREKRLEMVKQAAGSNYGENTTKFETPFNVYGLYKQIISRSLVAKTPKVMLSTDDRASAPAVAACEDWANDEADKMDLGRTLQRAATDAIDCIGIVKVGVATGGQSAHYGWGVRGGQPYAECIDLEDYVVDLHAKDWSEVAFEGHRYRLPLEAAKAMFRLPKGDEWSPEDDRDYNDDGDERITLLQRGATSSKDEMEDMVSLWELYIPRHKIVVTFLDSDGSGIDAAGLLDVRPYLGPYCGPYVKLCLGTVAGNLIPKAPGMDLLVFHKALQRFWRKLIDDTDRWKSVLPVPSGSIEDVTSLNDTRNGEAFRYDGRAEQLKEVVFGGPGQGVMLMVQAVKQHFDFLAGNMSMMGGLAAQSRTATQDKMLNDNSSQTVGDMQDTTTRFAAKVFEVLMWYWWNHPKKVMRSVLRVPGVPSVSTTRDVYPGTAPPFDPRGNQTMRRTGEPPKLRVDPYSLQHQTPQQVMDFLDATVTQLMPIMPVLQQQGVVFDANKWMELKAQFRQRPELKDLFTVQQPIAPQQGGDKGGGMPANTSREYIRRSVGADSQGAQENALSNAAAKGGTNGTLGAQ